MTAITVKTPSGKDLHVNIDTGVAECMGQTLTGFSSRVTKQLDRYIPGPAKAVGADHYMMVKSAAGERTQIWLKADAADQINALIEAREAEESSRRKAELEHAVPGLSELRAAIDEHADYDAACSSMMESEQNDGSRPPRRPASDLDALRARYPRAALYLKAEDYACASHHAKMAAGDKAMKILRSGGAGHEAQAVLDNWLPAEAHWD